MKSKFIEYYNSLSLAEKEAFTNGCIMCFSILDSALEKLTHSKKQEIREFSNSVLSCLIKEADDVVNNRKGE